jgi:hypothetical protein
MNAKFTVLFRVILAAAVVCGAMATGGGMENNDPPQQKDTAAKRVPGTALDVKGMIKWLAFTRARADAFIAGSKETNHEKYDPLVGYTHTARRSKDGVVGAICDYNYDPPGNRRMIAYRERPCRINTYGNSFTHCDQVSDGETWQEVLAAHLGESVRNYGISGHSVYQFYLRMKEREPRTPATYIVLNIYSDDHRRSLSGWGSLQMLAHNQRASVGGQRPPCPYVKVHPQTGQLLEFPNPCPSARDLYRLCDPDWIYETFKGDLTLQLALARAQMKRGHPEAAYAAISELARARGLDAKIGTPAALEAALDAIYRHDAVAASMGIVDKMEAYAATHGKRILYVLSPYAAHLARYLKDGYRDDQSFVDFLKRKRLPYVDLFEAHKADYAQYRIGIDEYLKRYYIGHYTPLGNHFTAFAIVKQLTELMDPKPPVNDDATLR